MTLLDRFIIEFDTALRSVVGGANAHRQPPGADVHSEVILESSEREHAAGLMRVNHVGEVCTNSINIRITRTAGALISHRNTTASYR